MADVIDTLIMKLGIDNSEFSEKMKDAQKQTDELEDKSEELSDSLRRAATFGTFLGTVLSKVFEKSVEYVSNAIYKYQDYIEQLRLISRETNQSIEDFQKWSYAIQYAGGNVSAFSSTFENLSKQIRTASYTHRSTFLRGLTELGIGVHYANGQIKSMSDLLLGLSGRLSGMSEGKALLIGQRLGLDDDTIRLLHEGKDAVQAYLDKTKEDEVIQKRNLETYERLRKIRVELGKNWNDFANRLGNYILPLLVKIGEIVIKVSDFLKNNSDLIKHTAMLIGILAGALGGLALVVGVLTNALGLLKIAMWGIGIGALILLWDDFMTYLEGGDSVIGKVIETFKSLGTTLKESFVGAIQFVKDFWEGFTDFFAEKIGWCIDLYDRFAGKISGLLSWFGIGKDIYDNVQAIASNGGNTSNVSNTSTTSWDLRGSTFMTQATNGQTLFNEFQNQTIINNSGGFVQ